MLNGIDWKSALTNRVPIVGLALSWPMMDTALTRWALDHGATEANPIWVASGLAGTPVAFAVQVVQVIGVMLILALAVRLMDVQGHPRALLYQFAGMVMFIQYFAIQTAALGAF